MSNEGLALVSFEVLEKNAIKCDDCENAIEMFSSVVCNECFVDRWSEEQIFNAIERVGKEKHYAYTYPDSYCGFKSDKDKKLHMDGVKRGMYHALFWMCAEIGGDPMVSLFEKRLEPHFYPETPEEASNEA